MSTLAVSADYKRASLHLFRALLRQCSYLPESIARREITRQVIHRFRAHRETEDEQSKPRTTEVTLAIRRRLKVGRQALRTLEKANDGGFQSLSLVLRHAYGRTGKRRHELVRNLLIASPSQIQGSISGKELSPPKSDDPWDITTVKVHDIFMAVKHDKKAVVEYHVKPEYSHLKAILASQTKMTSQMAHRARIKEHIPSIPTLNSWNRSMPRKRVKNMANRHYAYLIDRVLPPLPPEEWSRLDEIVNGARDCEPLPVRRAKLSSRKPARLKQNDLATLMYLSSQQTVTRSENGCKSSLPDSHVKAGRWLRQQDAQDSWFRDGANVRAGEEDTFKEEILLKPGFAMTRNLRNDPHAITSRYLRRHLASVFKECPRVVWDNAKMKWKVQWGMRQSGLSAEPKTPLQMAPLLQMLKESNV